MPLPGLPEDLVFPSFHASGAPFCENQLTPPYLASGTGFQATPPTCFGRYTESKTMQLVNIDLLLSFIGNISDENILVVSKISVAEKVGNKLF